MTTPRSRKRTAGADAAGIDLRRLRYLLAVCDHGGIQRAARAIGVAQPTITRQIQLLEEEIGQRLLERNGHNARPNEAGRFLVSRSRTHIEGLDATLRDLWQTFAAASGSVRLGVCPSIAPFFLDDLVHYVAARYPNLALSVVQAYSGDLRSLLLAGQIDCALTYRGSLGEGFSSIDLFSERLILVSNAKAFSSEVGTGSREETASRQDDRARFRSNRNGKGSRTRWFDCGVSIAELGDIDVILPGKTHQLRAIVDRVCASEGVELKSVIELDSLEAVKTMLLDEVSVRHAILPFHSVQQEVSSGDLSCSEISHVDMFRTIVFIAPERPRNSAAMECIGSWIRDRARELRAKLPTIL